MARRNRGVQAVLLGPDTKHGATPKAGARKYVWHGQWYEGGRRRLRSTGVEYGQQYEKAIESIRAEIAAQIASGGHSPPTKESTDVTVTIVLAEYMSRRGEGSDVIDQVGLQRRVMVLAKKLGHIRVQDLSDDDCAAYARSRPSPGTARLELGTLAAALNLAVRRRVIATAPHVWRPREPAPKDRVLDKTEIAALVRYWRRTPSRRHYAVATLIAYRTAARISSVLSLGWKQSAEGGYVDLGRDLIFLNPHGRALTKKVKPTLPVPRRLRPLLRGLKKRRPELPVCAGLRSVTPGVKTFDKQWVSACRALGIEGSTPHTLRHSRITHMLLAGADPVIVSEAVGLSVQVLMKKYKHVLPGHLRKGIDL